MQAGAAGGDRVRSLSLACAILVTYAAVAAADPVTYRFSGTVTSVFDDPALGFSASVGDRFSAVLTFPLPPRDPNADPRIGDFDLSEQAEFDLRLNTSGVSGAPIGGFARVELDGNVHTALFEFLLPGSFTDESGHTAPLDYKLLFHNFGLDHTPFLTSDALPTAATLNRAPSRFLLITPDCCETPLFEGDIQSVSGGPPAPTPEPASIALLGAAFIVELARRARSRIGAHATG